MPFYEYECSNCHYYVEVLQKLSDAPLRKCPSCAKSSLKKLVSAPVFRLKGSGWYETDFKTDKEHRRNLAGGEHEAANDAGKAADAKDTQETKSEAKPAGSAAAEPAKAAAAAGTGSAAPAKPSGASGAAETGSRRARASIRGKAKAVAKRAVSPARPGSRAKSSRRPGRR